MILGCSHDSYVLLSLTLDGMHGGVNSCVDLYFRDLGLRWVKLWVCPITTILVVVLLESI